MIVLNLSFRSVVIQMINEAMPEMPLLGLTLVLPPPVAPTILGTAHLEAFLLQALDIVLEVILNLLGVWLCPQCQIEVPLE